MVKIATQWKPSYSGTATADNAGDFVLLESGGHILLESGFKMLLEDSAVSEKSPTSWSDS